MKNKKNPVKKNKKAMELPNLEDVKDLGGDETDYQIIQLDDDDGESVELDGDSSDSEALKMEVEALVNKLGFSKKRKSPDDEEDDSKRNAKKSKETEPSATSVAQPNARLIKKPPNSNAVSSEKDVKQPDTKTTKASKAVAPVQPNGGSKATATPALQTSLKAVKNVDFTMKSRKYLLVKAGNWMDNQFADDSVPSEPLPKESMEKMEVFARKLLAEEVSLYRSQQDRKRSSMWMNKVLTSGTAADKMAALIVLVQDSPVHNLSSLDGLVSMLKMKERRKSIVVLDSLKKLFLTNLLPNRKLKPFAQQALSRVVVLASGNKDTQDKRLLMWYFESQLKQKYENFIRAVEILSTDSIELVKSKAIATIFELLCEKAEQEKVLLSMLVNKLGDPVRKMAARTAHLLSQLVERHPNMKTVVTLEVERLLYRTNVTAKAQYYAICFLKGLRLSQDDGQLAARLIVIYFSFFKAYVAKGEIDSKMLSGLLGGVNRVYPFARVDRQKIAEQYETLFRLIHVSNFTTSVQALMLLFQIVDVSDSSADRFYMAVYRKMLDAELPLSSKLPMFLNLLLKSMKKDPMVTRVQAFVKRLLQVVTSFTPAFACSALLVLSELLKDRPNLLNLRKDAEDSEEDEEEHFVDLKTEDDDDVNDADETPASAAAAADIGVADTESSGLQTPKAPSWVHRKNLSGKRDTYDPLHRNPLFCRAEKDCVWEILNLTRHYHPSVQVFASTILQGQSVDYASNPLEDFSLQRFLDRFVTRNPKKKSGELDGEDKDGLSDENSLKNDGYDESAMDDEDEEDDSYFDSALDKFEAHIDED